MACTGMRKKGELPLLLCEREREREREREMEETERRALQHTCTHEERQDEARERERESKGEAKGRGERTIGEEEVAAFGIKGGGGGCGKGEREEPLIKKKIARRLLFGNTLIKKLGRRRRFN